VDGRIDCPVHRPQVNRTARTNRRFRRLAREVKAAHPWCSVCGSLDDLTVDHLMPLAQGGDLYGALRVVCRRCNSARGVGS